jgi:VanZ family protein
MQQEIKKNKTAAIVFWVLTVVVMGLIFFFSSRTADESSQQSDFLLKFLRMIFGEGALSDFLVRKAAHFCEFALLSFMFNFSFLFSCGKPKRILSVSLSSAYAATDEFHQLFVEGRACQFVDWLIDSAGALTGLLAFCLLLIIIHKIKVSKEERI